MSGSRKGLPRLARGGKGAGRAIREGERPLGLSLSRRLSNRPLLRGPAEGLADGRPVSGGRLQGTCPASAASLRVPSSAEAERAVGRTASTEPGCTPPAHIGPRHELPSLRRPRPSSPSPFKRRYLDDTCVMGYCCNDRCPNAPHMWQLGWSQAVLLNGTNLPVRAHQRAHQQSTPTTPTHTRARERAHPATQPPSHPATTHTVPQFPPPPHPPTHTHTHHHYPPCIDPYTHTPAHSCTHAHPSPPTLLHHLQAGTTLNMTLGSPSLYYRSTIRIRPDWAPAATPFFLSFRTRVNGDVNIGEAYGNRVRGPACLPATPCLPCAPLRHAAWWHALPAEPAAPCAEPGGWPEQCRLQWRLPPGSIGALRGSTCTWPRCWLHLPACLHACRTWQVPNSSPAASLPPVVPIPRCTSIRQPPLALWTAPSPLGAGRWHVSLSAVQPPPLPRQ